MPCTKLFRCEVNSVYGGYGSQQKVECEFFNRVKKLWHYKVLQENQYRYLSDSF